MKVEGGNGVGLGGLVLEAVRLVAHDQLTRERMNRHYEFVMVDEYQDTNRSQYELMQLLSGERKNLCVVGDEDQSIYGWRAANNPNSLDFQPEFPGAPTNRPYKNYPSPTTIPHAASAAILHTHE